MTRLSQIFTTLVLLSVISHCSAGIAVKSRYAYDQQGPMSFVGSEEIVGSIERTITLPNAIYKFDIVSDSSNIYELKSKAKFEAEIDGRNIDGFSGDGWQRSEVTAFSSTQLVDTAIVEGLSGQTDGIVEFLWDVTGGSTIKLDPKLEMSDAYLPHELYTTAFFNTLEENAIPELLVNNQSNSNPGPGATSVDSSMPGFFAPVVVAVEWSVGEELDVFFELQTNARLNVENFDAAGFTALVNSEFSNTATMTAVRIYDDQDNLIPDAVLRSVPDGFIYNPVPEPSSFIGLAMGLLAFARLRRRR